VDAVADAALQETRIAIAKWHSPQYFIRLEGDLSQPYFFYNYDKIQMKESYYNIYAPVGEKTICYNTVSNSFVLMPKKLYSAIASGDFDSMSEEEMKTLADNNIITPDEVDEELDILIKNYEKTASDESGTYELTLLPTLDCNLRCWYCFETHVTGSRMSREVSEAIFNHVEKVCKRENIKHIHIELFGGEPLMYFREELYPLLSRIKTMVEGFEKNVSFFFVTNGVCITEEMIPLFANLRASFQISIDGYREKHNKVKKIPGSGEDVYCRIMKTIHQLAEAYETYINLRINYDDQTLNHIEDVIRDIIDINPQRLGIHLERVWQTKREGNNIYDMNRILAFIIANGFCVSYMNLHRKHVSCKAGNSNQAVISWNGDVYKCTGRNFTPDHREGILQKDGTIIWEKDKLDRRLSIQTYDNETCRKCKYLPQCCGPCCQKQLDKPGEIMQFCQLRLMEITKEEYILYSFKNELLRHQIYETN
jgi:uncharacterized protein